MLTVKEYKDVGKGEGAENPRKRPQGPSRLKGYGGRRM